MSDFTFFSDPGHGWLKVRLAQLEELGLTPQSFSGRGSYIHYGRHGHLYLEEDCDAPQFIKAWEAKHGRKMVIREAYVEYRSTLFRD